MLLISVLLLPLGGLVLSVDEAYAADEVTFTGIAQDSDGEPLAGAEVYLMWDAGDTGKVWGTATSNPDGAFTVVLPETYDPQTNTLILVYKTSTQIMICDEIDPGTLTDFNLGGVRAVYQYTTERNMTVVGTVKYGSELISGATVTLLDPNGAVKGTDTTGADGKYSIDCEPGTYTVTVRCGGFEDAAQYNIGVGYESSSKTCDFYLVLTPEETYWGLDLPHLFTLVGLFVAGILLIIVTAFIIYIKRHN